LVDSKGLPGGAAVVELVVATAVDVAFVFGITVVATAGPKLAGHSRDFHLCFRVPQYQSPLFLLDQLKVRRLDCSLGLFEPARQ